MKKIITQEQISQILGTFYQTNISAKDFDLIKEFLSKLPAVPEEKKD